ncbi:saccharopine dehydrogenase [candidate division WOR-3 bacterium JGI_Cruoil_03_51_56]|uniref:Saccharopine dehydrogenase n=1 Tax=candidate division WOR-3 bacterium JGI_Cruoil_03_51_56 TaxID=1973747 RepID=A0A235BWA3_UNCW3|nr:MAG: saccharopine dehydrogenase [candidate division WOR-3 bacterium JGI_Cruoil_03_51_56]
MKKVLVLGAGLVSRPMAHYLLDIPDIQVTVASRTVSKAEALLNGHPHGRAIALLVEDSTALDRLIAKSNLVVSLLPYGHHPKVARYCIKRRKPMVTASYVSKEMKILDKDARKAGVIILNEVGLDPGIDHMSAMKTINWVRKHKGVVTSFMSYCGGLPAPDANDNPFGYKFSWSPKGVLMAGHNEASYLREGRKVFVPSEKLFGHRWSLTIEGAGEFEAYPNRDSLPYIELYGLEKIKTMFRGTLRYPGWCETLEAISHLGLLDDVPNDDIAGLTAAAWLREHVPGDGDLRADTAAELGLVEDTPVLDRLEWLGLFNDEPIGLARGSDVDVLVKLMLNRMTYRPHERDMIILRHEFGAEYPGGLKKKITSTLVAYGEPDGDSAMARTVGLPTAIAVRKILEGRIKLTGVHIPVIPEIYKPILTELERLGIRFREKSAKVA